jgi:hypothetical protein
MHLPAHACNTRHRCMWGATAPEHIWRSIQLQLMRPASMSSWEFSALCGVSGCDLWV